MGHVSGHRTYRHSALQTEVTSTEYTPTFGDESIWKKIIYFFPSQFSSYLSWTRVNQKTLTKFPFQEDIFVFITKFKVKI